MKSRRQPYKQKKRFYNNQYNRPESFLFKTLYTFVESLHNRKNRVPETITEWHHCKVPLSCTIEPLITWIGHATFLIQVENMNIVTDPIFGDASFLYRRVLPPGIVLHELPHIDVILLSHNHRDHMDSTSLIALKKQFPAVHILVPWGDKAWFDKRGFNNVFQYEWWQQQTFSFSRDGHKTGCFTFLPASHWSQRGLFDKNKSLWGSWMIESNGHTIYFAGDTSWDNHFEEINDEFDTIDCALMPIGPCEPSEKMRHAHIDADQAGQGFLALDATHFVPMHWGTFLFGTDHVLTPIQWLQTWWQNNRRLLDNKRLHIAKIGQGIKLI